MRTYNSSVMNRKSQIPSSVVMLIVGIALLFLKSTALSVLVLVCGILLIVAAGLSFYFSYNSAKAVGGNVPVLSVVNLLVCLAVGLWMVLAPGSAASLFVYIIAIGMMLFGGFHILSLMGLPAGMKVPGFFYIVPVLLVLCGLTVMSIGAGRTQDYIVLICGIALIVYGLSTLCEGLSYTKALNK